MLGGTGAGVPFRCFYGITVCGNARCMGYREMPQTRAFEAVWATNAVRIVA